MTTNNLQQRFPGHEEQFVEAESSQGSVLSQLQAFAKNLFTFLGIKQIYDLKKIHIYSDKILRCMYEYISTLDYEEQLKASVQAAFHSAVRKGTVEFIMEMLKACPHVIICTDENSRTLFMSSIANRQEKVVSLIYGLEVESIINPTDKDFPNVKGQIARELFTSDHEDLLVKGEEWMKATATSCTVVGALIITIIFTVAFTVLEYRRRIV